jgi:pseudo-rSAM protein
MLQHFLIIKFNNYEKFELDVFNKNIFNTLEDIFEAKPSQKDIFIRQAINQLNFGKLFILPDGSVYSNLNAPKLGTLQKHSLYDLIQKELYKQKNWFKLRKNDKPCKGCVYNLLCPPISTYEYVIGKYNLCNVLENKL